MKKLFVKVLGVCAMLVTVSGLNAQKIAHLSVDTLLSTMPEFKTVQERSDAKRQEYSKTIIDIQNKMAALEEDVRTNYDKMSDLDRQMKQEEYASFQERLQKAQQIAEQGFQAYTSSLQKPIFDKVNKAIELVAKENGYKYVLSKGDGTLLYADPSDDITALVKKKMDSMPPAKLPEETVKPGAGTGNPGGTGTGTKPGGAGAGGTGTGAKPKPAGGGK